jgi:5-methylthioadenosine/S-adenosylhomocysteine deaminase
MKFASLLQKSSRWDATVLPAQKCLDLATLDAAKALGAEKELGSIEVGKRADIVILDCMRPSMIPVSSENAVSNIVYASPSHAVRDTIVEGKFVLRDGKIMNLDECSFLLKAEEQARQLMSKSQQVP